MNKTKMKLLYLIDIFTQQSDEFHPLSMQEILTLLEAKDIFAERKSIYEDIKCLQAWGLDIVFIKSPKQGYYLANKLLDSIEVKILVDAIYATEFMTIKKSQQLTDKLCNLISVYDAHQINLQKNSSTKKFKNEHIYYTIDTIQHAIQLNQSIEFRYFDITLDKQKKYRKNASFYTLTPYSLLYQNQRYYCIGYSSKYNNFIHYRVDKMDQVHQIDTDQPMQNFNLKNYISNNFEMTIGDVENISIQFDLSLLNVVYDQFGQDVFIEKIESSTFTINLSTTLSPTFIGWLIQFGSRAKVIRPKKLINQIETIINDVHQLYQKQE